MKLGAFTVGRFWLAPMAEVSRQPFRVLCRELGAGLTSSELLPPEVFFLSGDAARPMLAFDPHRERPHVMQLHAGEEALLARAAGAAVALGAEVLDVNMGNPLPGSRTRSWLLMPARAAQLITLLRKVTGDRVPITVKTRAGIDDPREVLALARAVEDAGCAAITVHPRTRKQRYSGAADWSLLAALKRTVSMPVIGNGDVRTVADAWRMLRETGCDAVMVGRAALGNPFLFRALADEKPWAPPSHDEKYRVISRHWALHRDFDPARAVAGFRHHLAWYARATDADLLRRVSSVTSVEATLELIAAVSRAVDQHEPGLTTPAELPSNS